jgi:hypothetical protein
MLTQATAPPESLAPSGKPPAWQAWPLLPAVLANWILASTIFAPQELGADGALSVGMALRPPLDALRFLRHDVHPPLFYLALRGWLDLAGHHFLDARWLSLACGALSVTFLYAIGRRLVGQRGALASAGLFAVAPAFVSSSATVRDFAPGLCVSLLSVLLALHAIERPTRGRLAALLIVNALALLTWYFQPVFMLAGLAYAALRKPRLIPTLLAGWVGVGVLMAPWLAFSVPSLLAKLTSGQTFSGGTRTAPKAGNLLGGFGSEGLGHVPAWLHLGDPGALIGGIWLASLVVGAAVVLWQKPRTTAPGDGTWRNQQKGFAASGELPAASASQNVPACRDDLPPIADEPAGVGAALGKMAAMPTKLRVPVRRHQSAKPGMPGALLLATGGIGALAVFWFARFAWVDTNNPGRYFLAAIPFVALAQGAIVSGLARHKLVPIGAALMVCGLALGVNEYWRVHTLPPIPYEQDPLLNQLQAVAMPDDVAFFSDLDEFGRYELREPRPIPAYLVHMAGPPHVGDDIPEMIASTVPKLSAGLRIWFVSARPDAPAYNAMADTALEDAYYYVGQTAFPNNFLLREYANGPALPLASRSATLGQVQLASAGFNPTVKPGGVVAARLEWQAAAKLDQNYSGFLHLVAPSGAVVAQQDGWPRGGLAPTSAWQPGQTMEDRRAVVVPSDAPPGAYDLRTGMYGPDGQPLAPEFDLGQVTVNR